MSTKLIFTAFASATLLFSCQKADIQPMSNADSSAEAQRIMLSTKPASDTHVSIYAAKGSEANCGVDAGNTGVTIGNITDPNNDEDRNKKKQAIKAD